MADEPSNSAGPNGESGDRRRVQRLIRGEGRSGDIVQLLVSFRELKPYYRSLRELGDFAAHRSERDRGLSISQSHLIQISARSWALGQIGQRPPHHTLHEVADANLKLIPPDEFKNRIGITRRRAERSFKSGMKKLDAVMAGEKGIKFKAIEKEMINRLGGSMMWQYAFDDVEICEAFAKIAIANDLASSDQEADLQNLRTPIALEALALLHKARLRLNDGQSAPLFLDSYGDSGSLHIKAEIEVLTQPKPVAIAVPIFHTSIPASKHCDQALLENEFGFAGPIEVGADLKLVELI